METTERCCQDSRWYRKPWYFVGFGILGVIGMALFALIFGWVIMVLWNALMPQIFGLTVLSFWQAVGLAVLARLLFGCSHMGRRHWKHRHWHHRHNCGGIHDEYYGHKHHHKHGSCGCDGGRWQYYEQYWEEVGEKSFKEYVDHKKEESNKNEDPK